MRRFIRSVALCALVLPTAAAAMGKGKPQPITCPTDVASAMAEQCPCAGKMLPDGSVAPWRNHGQYMTCVVHLRNALRKGGCLTADTRRTLARCGARSTCGKATAVLCCVTETGVCSDPTPGDGTAAGTCSNAADMACDTSADCTETHAHLASDDAACTASGGVSTGAGSVCDSCTSSTTTSTTTTTTTLP
jgi:hypothetical protein